LAALSIVYIRTTWISWQTGGRALLCQATTEFGSLLLVNVLHSMGHLRMNQAHVYTGDNKVFPRQTVPGICWWCICPIARSPVCDSRSKDYWQHCPGHLPSSVHVCCYWSPVV